MLLTRDLGQESLFLAVGENDRWTCAVGQVASCFRSCTMEGVGRRARVCDANVRFRAIADVAFESRGARNQSRFPAVCGRRWTCDCVGLVHQFDEIQLACRTSRPGDAPFVSEPSLTLPVVAEHWPGLLVANPYGPLVWLTLCGALQVLAMVLFEAVASMGLSPLARP